MMQQLLQYVVNYLRQGYSVQSIRQALLSSGWPEHDVDEALNIAYKQLYQNQKVDHTLHVSKTTIFLVLSSIAGIALILVLVGYIMSSGGPTTPVTPDQLLDYQIKINRKELAPGGQLQFINSFKNMGTAPRYDLFIEYTISNGKEVDSWQESKAITSSLEYTTTRKLPKDVEEGRYSLDVVVRYDKEERKAYASDNFRVVVDDEPTCNDGLRNQGEAGIDCGGPCEACDRCNDGVRNQGELGVDCGGPCPSCDSQCGDCDDGDACTEDLCVRGECLYRKVEPCCGNGKCEEGEGIGSCPDDCEQSSEDYDKMNVVKIKEKATELASQSTKEAGEFCDAFSETKKKDYCFRTAAHESGEKSLCDFIEEESTSDFCYMKFATMGDTTVCPKIQNVHLKTACETLRSR